MLIRLAQRELETKFGSFTEILYGEGQTESIALVVGEVSGQEDILCRIHSACIGGHVFNSVECECADEMAAAQAATQQAGKGVIIYLDQEGKGNGHLGLMKSIPFKKAGMSQADAYVAAGFATDARDYRPAAEILADLGVLSVILLTGNTAKGKGLENAGMKVAGFHPLAAVK